MLWKTTHRTLELPGVPLLMGVLNVTPDSFSDGGRWMKIENAVAHGLQMIREGAQIIDIGGESSRPGALPVTESEELQRVLPVVEELRKTSDVLLSIDTAKPTVAARAIAKGADIINDIGGLQSAAMRELLVRSGAGVVCMHMQGSPETMQNAPVYRDVVLEVRDFFEQTLSRCLQEGMTSDQIVFDPGIGFGKTAFHNFLLLRNLKRLEAGGRPLALGVSRKSFLMEATGVASMNERLWPTIAISTYAFDQQISVLRVHEVAPNAAALRVRALIAGAGRAHDHSREFCAS
jgi:dihydropteroate synthase